MKLRNLAYSAVLVVGTAAITSQVVSQDPGAIDDKTMERMMKLGSPGEHHKFLEPMVGTWEQTVKMWMGPGEPTVNTSEATYKWILDGRFIQGHYKGDFDGMPFKGFDIIGYDNVRNEYVSIWCDNMSTSVMIARGEYNDDKVALVMSGKHDDVMSGKRDVPFRNAMTMVSEDEIKYESWTKGPDGEMHKNLEVVSQRIGK